MPTRTTTPALWADTDPFIERFERQLAAGGADLGDFLPPGDHPHFLTVLCELVRVELESGWRADRPRPVTDYLARFPRLSADPAAVAEIAFEEYRLRAEAGQRPRADEYRERYGIDTSRWPAEVAEPSRALAGTAADRASLPTVVVPAAPQVAEPAAEELLTSLSAADPHRARQLADALGVLANTPDRFHGYTLVRELGRGAFGRVFLATQPDLGGRPVVLKMSADLRGEPETLARLRHTNIMPVYAVHRSGPVAALCMPYLGRLTLADLTDRLKGLPALPQDGRWLADLVRAARESPATDPGGHLDRLTVGSYADAVTWVAARLAAGLAHAHARGVLHQDIKPANVLLADDGEPLLLDFNLATGGWRDTAPAAYIGGTLPYMSPERLAAFRDSRQHADPRDDVYAVGLLLHELYTGKPPSAVRRGVPVDDALRELIAGRTVGLPSVRASNPAVPPSVAAIIGKCLAPAAADRYPSAVELADDLHRHLTDLPLKHAAEPGFGVRVRKWARRHPRLSSGYAVGTVAAVLLAATAGLYAWRTDQLARADAANTLHAFRAAVAAAEAALATPSPDGRHLAAGRDAARRALARYAIPDDPARLSPDRLGDVDRQHLRIEVYDLLLMAARGEHLAVAAGVGDRATAQAEAERLNRLAERYAPDAEAADAVRLQRAWLSQLAGRPGVPAVERSGHPPRTARGLRAAAADQIDRGGFRVAADLLRQATRLDPADPRGWFLLGYSHTRAGRPDKAVPCFDTALALRPGSAVTYYHRGAAYAADKQYPDAIADFDQVVRLDPDFLPAYLDRGLAKAAAGDHREAAAEFDTVLGMPDAPTRVYFLRSMARGRLGDRPGAATDRAEGLARRPAEPVSWTARGVAKLGTDPAAALADFDEALKLAPGYAEALQNKANVLAESLGRPAEAVAALDGCVEANPEFVLAWAGRAVLHARAGRRAEAIRDAKTALGLSQDAAVKYQAGCVYALTSQEAPADADTAIRLLGEAVRGGFGRQLLATDTDLDPIRNRPGFRLIGGDGKR